MKHLIISHATVGLAVSRKAAEALFGSTWEADQRWRVLHCGLDLESFRCSVVYNTARTQLGLPEDAFVIGHVGRFVEVKNHGFLIQVLLELVKHEPKTYLLLVGDGPLRSAIEQQVTQAGLVDRVVFAGSRSDVPYLMLSAMDAFLFPSLYEGLGLVLIEAQAAGLACILSDVVPEEADIVKPLVYRLSLLQPAAVWAEAVLATRNVEPVIAPTAALEIVQKSVFNISRSVEQLEQIYHG